MQNDRGVGYMYLAARRNFVPSSRAALSMATLASACATALQSEGVVGVMCVDGHGLCLHSAGKVPEASGGAVAALAQQSQHLLGNDATVTVESPQGKIVLSRCEGASVAVFMQPTAAPAN